MVAYNPPGTLADVHAYVTGVTAAATQAPSTLRLHVTHANMAGTTFAEVRLSRNDTPPTLRDRLYRVTGTRPAAMELALMPPAGAAGAAAPAIPLTDDAAPLGAVAPAVTDGWTLHVTDADGAASASAGGRLSAHALPTDAERFVLTDAAYAARPDSVRAVKARMRAAEAAAAAAADGVWTAQHEWAGEEMRRVCVGLGGFYAKAGQFLATRVDFGALGAGGWGGSVGAGAGGAGGGGGGREGGRDCPWRVWGAWGSDPAALPAAAVCWPPRRPPPPAGAPGELPPASVAGGGAGGDVAAARTCI